MIKKIKLFDFIEKKNSVWQGNKERQKNHLEYRPNIYDKGSIALADKEK